MAINPEIRQALRAALKKLDTELAKKSEEVDTTLFRVNPITNGYIVTFTDVEEFEVKVPIYDPPGHPTARQLGQPPKMQPQRRWRLAQREVFCADAGEVKDQVDDALKLEQKVKNLVAEGVLGGNDGYEDTLIAGA